MNKKIRITVAMLCTLLIGQSALVFADSFSVPSSSNYYWSGSIVPTNPWNGNPYAVIKNNYLGSDSTSTVTIGTEVLINGKTGNGARLDGNGSTTIHGSSYLAATIFFI